MRYDTIDNLAFLTGKNDKSIDYLARIIVFNSSEVLLGCKPACTITFSKNNPHNTLELWNMYKYSISNKSKLDLFEIHNTDDFTVVFFYDKDKLRHHLQNKEVSSFLHRLGYEADTSLEEKLLVLKQKFSYSIPHEIGIFLGIPLKDVLGFMGLEKFSQSFTLGWRIYGNPDPSIKLYTHYKACKTKILHMLLENISPMSILNAYPQ